MPTPLAILPHSSTELVLARILDAPHEKVYRCWTEPELITQWFTPPPWKTTKAVLDLRPGGSSMITMQGPDGTEIPNHGIYLDVAPNARLIFTDAFTRAWQPSGKAFMVVTLTFAPEGEGKTRYIARVAHWTLEDKKAHEDMGFETGWGIATEQLEALARTL